MTALEIRGDFNGEQLMDELLAALPALRPTPDGPRLRVDSAPGLVRLVFPEAVSAEAVLAVVTAHDPAAERPKAQLRRRVLALAAGAAGQQVEALTPAQVEALLKVVLLKAGALAPDGTVRPLEAWT